MKMSRKLFSILLAIMMVVTIVPITASAATYSGTCGENLTWTFDESTGTLTISGTGEIEDGLSINCPWKNYKDKIKAIIIEDGITSIDDFAFNDYTSLTSVTIPDSVTAIKDWAFSDCTTLTSVAFSDNVTTIGACAFFNCYSLTNVTLSDNITSIGSQAFYNCRSLTSVTLPNSITTISVGLFANCENLTSVNIPDSVITIENDAFAWTSLTSVNIPDSVITIKDNAFAWTSLTSVNIPDSVTEIGARAFGSCSSLTDITVNENNKFYSSDEYGVLYNKNKTALIQYPAGNSRTSYTIFDSVTSIGDEAFYGCSSLTSITLPNGVTSIGSNAFYNTGYSNNIDNWDNNVLYINNYLIEAKENIMGECSIEKGTILIADGTFYSCKNLESVIIPESVMSIGNRAFMDCWSLTNVTIGSNVTMIGNDAFAWTSLTSVIIPDSVTTVGENAFAYCDRLVNLSIGNGITSINDGAFYFCCNITNIIIPDNVTYIGDSAFGSWTRLTDVYYEGAEEQWNSISIGSGNSYLKNASIHYKKVSSDVGIIIENENYNSVPNNTKLNVSLLETTEDSITYDITLTNNGTEIQPNGNVTVKIPVPNDLDGSMLSVYRAEEDGTYTNMNAIFDNGYMVFITDHFSKYIVTTDNLSTPEEPEYNYTFSIQQPSRTEIRNKDGIILHAKVEGNTPADSYVRWESSNGNFDKNVNGSNLKIIAKNKGYTTFTAILCDADGNELARDTVEMYSKSGFFDKIGGFFRGLFGMTKIYEN